MQPADSTAWKFTRKSCFKWWSLLLYIIQKNSICWIILRLNDT